jgi:predicted nucleotidyltransferase
MNSNVDTGLSNVDLENIVKTIKKNNRIEEAILFGSRAKGTHAKSSDVDLALKGAALKLNDVLNVLVELDDLLLPYKFDVIIFDRIEEKALIEHIERVGVVLFAQY